MTITLNLTPEEEAKLTQRAVEAGNGDPADYVKALVVQDTYLAGRTLLDRLNELGVVGSVSSTPRADGKSWSEIEAPCDPS